MVLLAAYNRELSALYVKETGPKAGVTMTVEALPGHCYCRKD
jgi:hypothetical protein